MTDLEMEKLCEKDPQCNCNCAQCPIMGMYVSSQLGYEAR